MEEVGVYLFPSLKSSIAVVYFSTDKYLHSIGRLMRHNYLSHNYFNVSVEEMLTDLEVLKLLVSKRKVVFTKINTDKFANTKANF